MIREVTEQEWQRDIYSKYGEFWDRTFASLIDALIVSIPYLIIEYIIEYTFNISMPTIISQLVFLAYPIIWHWKTGATIGKKNFELRVENIDGKRITLKQSIKREIFTIFSIIYGHLSILINVNESGFESFWIWIPANIVLIDVFWLFSNKEKQTLHDVVAKTYCRKK